MTEEHERRRKADALLALQEAQVRYEDRLEVAKELGTMFRGLADILESSTPGNLPVESYENLMNYAHLVSVISDVRKAEQELQEASAHSAQMNKLERVEWGPHGSGLLQDRGDSVRRIVRAVRARTLG